MLNASITGWGKCLPPAILSNADIATFIETTDEWVTTRTGIRERRISHVSLSEMAHVASVRALACAGLAAKDLDLIVFGTTTHDDQCPNMASGLQKMLGADFFFSYGKSFDTFCFGTASQGRRKKPAN